MKISPYFFTYNNVFSNERRHDICADFPPDSETEKESIQKMYLQKISTLDQESKIKKEENDQEKGRKEIENVN